MARRCSTAMTEIGFRPEGRGRPEWVLGEAEGWKLNGSSTGRVTKYGAGPIGFWSEIFLG